MRVADVASIVIISPVGPVSEAAVCEVAFQERALRAVLVVDDPAPGCAQEVEGALGLADGEVALELEGGDERGDVVGQFGRDGADWGPVVC